MRSKLFVPSVLVLALVLGVVAYFQLPEEEPEAPPKEVGSWVAELSTRTSALYSSVEDRRKVPWLLGSRVIDELTTMSARLNGLYARLGEVPTSFSSDEQEVAVRGQMQRYEAQVSENEQRYLAFDRRLVEDGETIFQAFTTVRAVASNASFFDERGLRDPDLQSKVRDVARKHDEGRKYWLDQLRRVLRGEELDPTIRRMGLATLKSAYDEVFPLLEPTKKAKVRLNQLDNYIQGIEKAFAWGDGLLESLPEDDQFRSSTGRIEPWRERFAPLAGSAREARKIILEEDREQRRAEKALGEKLGRLLHEFNNLYLPKAREVGFPLPRGA